MKSFPFYQGDMASETLENQKTTIDIAMVPNEYRYLLDDETKVPDGQNNSKGAKNGKLK